MNIVIALLIFGIIIAVHEFGHFILAKFNKIFVTEFSLGFGKRLVSFVPTSKGYRLKFLLKQDELDANKEWEENTVYSLKLFPFGGSCAMLGEDENNEDERAFNNKGPLARFSVVAAGAIFNFILAFILSTIIVAIIGYDPAFITNVQTGSAADEAGLKDGDLITEINGKNISINKEMAVEFLINPVSEKPIEVEYERDGKKHDTVLNPKYREYYRLGFTYYPDTNQAIIKELTEDSPLANVGIKVGDVITKFNENIVGSGEELAKILDEKPLTKEDISITYTRDGDEYTEQITPEFAGEGYELGFFADRIYEKVNFLEALKYGVIEVKYNIVTTLRSFKMLFTGNLGFDNLAGPVGIVNMIGDTYEVSKVDGALVVFINLASLTILISANVGVINLLPLPAFDGGRLVFLIIELIRGKPVPAEKEGLVHTIGLIAIMVLAVFILFNDIIRLI